MVVCAFPILRLNASHSLAPKTPRTDTTRCHWRSASGTKLVKWDVLGTSGWVAFGRVVRSAVGGCETMTTGALGKNRLECRTAEFTTGRSALTAFFDDGSCWNDGFFKMVWISGSVCARWPHCHGGASRRQRPGKRRPRTGRFRS